MNNLYSKSSLVFWFNLLFFSFLEAQTTGSFAEEVNFDAVDYDFTRTLYYHVPEDYNPSVSYKLVVGLRGGPHVNAGEFRDQLTFLSDSIGAIILCPENIAHFGNQEELVKQLFQYSVAEAMQTYNIDTNFIYLTGLSFGGRHAVIVSMDTNAGPIPNLRGVIPFATGSGGDLVPDYESISDFPPACICIGLEDSPNFINVSNAIHNDIQSNGGVSMLNEIPNVGHTVDFPTYELEMMECFAFIENQYDPTGVEDNREVEINLFPNPTKDVIHLVFKNDEGIEKINIEDMEGRTVRAYEISDRSLDVTSLTSGTYLVVVWKDGQPYARRFTLNKE